MRRTLLAFLISALALPVAAQDANFLYPMDVIEQRLRANDMRFIDIRGSRATNDRTQRVTVQFDDSAVMIIKWAASARGGEEFNNEPRYELAAYAFQKMFLPPDEYVVPPTVIRAFPAPLVQEVDDRARPTFDDANSIVVLLQYWMSAVTGDEFWDDDRFDADTVYARYFGNMNLVTHLIDHRDANTGNFLISTVPQTPRVFTVDNGVAFRSQRSNRGTEWGRLRVDRLPHATVERLRSLTEEQLHEALAVLVEFEVRDGFLVQVTPGANLDDGDGVRNENGRIQFGLTRNEIRDIWRRIGNVLEDVDDGDIETF